MRKKFRTNESSVALNRITIFTDNHCSACCVTCILFVLNSAGSPNAAHIPQLAKFGQIVTRVSDQLTERELLSIIHSSTCLTIRSAHSA